MKKIVLLVAVLVGLQLANVSASYAAPPAWGGDDGGRGTYHTVRYGETLFSIGRRYGVNPYHIARVNGLYDPDYIYAGQVLHIPAGSDCGYGCDDGYGHRPGGGNCRGYDCQQPDYGNYPGGGNCRGYGCQQPDQGHYPGGGNCGGYGCGDYGHGYDYTGYYYYNNYPQYQRYSYTCGYDYNCRP